MTMPLATLVLYAYNEERYIREAVASAFAQTYSLLEIFLSDDGSADHTFEIMQEMAAAYQGPHRIILNRNPHNIGIGSQLNAAYQKTQGDFIVLANADDISLPERVAVLVEHWLASNRQASVSTCAIPWCSTGFMTTTSAKPMTWLISQPGASGITGKRSGRKPNRSRPTCKCCGIFMPYPPNAGRRTTSSAPAGWPWKN